MGALKAFEKALQDFERLQRRPPPYTPTARRRGKGWSGVFLSLVGLFGLAFVISPAFEAKLNLAIPVSFQEANEIIQTRCVSCHSANPSDEIWKSAPNGVMYDTPEQIKLMSDKVMTRAVRSKSMPLGNITNMTDEERKVLKRWILQGSNIDN